MPSPSSLLYKSIKSLLLALPLWAQPLLALEAPSEVAQGLVVFPTRLVFENRRRTGEVNLSNPGNAPCEYRISLVGMEVDNDGTFKEVPLERTPGQVAVQDLIRFSPKQVSLNPQEGQVIRLQVRKPADLPPGEYRLHLLLRQVPPPPQAPAESAGQAGPPSISVQMNTLFGVSIPVILRQGETSARATLSGLKLDADSKTLRCRLERSGNQSVYGHVKVTFRPHSGESQVLAEVKGVAVYTSNAFRNLDLSLGSFDPAMRKTEGILQVSYSAPPEDGGALLAEGSLSLH